MTAQIEKLLLIFLLLSSIHLSNKHYFFLDRLIFSKLHFLSKFHMKIIKGFCCFMVLFIMSSCDSSSSNVANQKHEAKKILTESNKIPLKSIKSSDGDIIDCVRISDQPAFDHPLLKNHTIQMRPSYYPKGLFSESKISNSKPHSKNGTQPIIQLWHLNGRCPEGTIPIRRTKQEDLSTDSFIKKKKFPQLPLADGSFHEHACASTFSDNYYGAKATINVWNPRLEDNNEFSLSQIWIAGGYDSDVNTIEVGWIVFPGLFGDNNTRLFTYWTRDNYGSTGCFNLRCSGFVQTSKKVALGVTIQPLSSYHGPQYEITIVVWKDPKEGMWWLQYENEVIGYWPSSLFTNLADSASLVEWGGEVASTKSEGPHTTTQMGSGHFPEEGFGGASFFKDLLVVDSTNTFKLPDELEPVLVKPSCYNVKTGKSDEWGDYFYYGGPGRNPNCP